MKKNSKLKDDKNGSPPKSRIRNRNEKFSKELRAWVDEDKELRRSKLGQHVLLIKQNLIEDLGGSVNQSQDILLDLICQKILIVFLINEHANSRQDEIIDKDGNLLPCLKKSYLAYCNSLRLDLAVLGELGRINSSRSFTLNLEDYISQKYGSKG